MTWIANSIFSGNVINVFFTPQDPNIAPVFVPRVRHVFPTKNNAYMFYRDYARLAGFSLRTVRTSKKNNHWVCSMEGCMKERKGRSPTKLKRDRKNADALHIFK